jgi:ribonuclease D
VISREALWELARKAPQTIDGLRDLTHLGKWRIKTYGEEILAVIAGVR